MFEVKRKPNSPGSRGTTVPAPRPFQDSAARVPTGEAPALQSMAVQSSPRLRTGHPIVAAPPSDSKGYQTKLPVITGEAQYKGMLNVDGTASGQVGGSGGSLTVRQRSRSFFSEPEFSGEVSFRDAIRVNGHIAGTVYSKTGTLIVDVSATVNAHVDVAVAVISGTVKGDIIAHQRVEIGPNARIYGNIYTRSIEIKNGAIFEGVCTMMAKEQIAG